MKILFTSLFISALSFIGLCQAPQSFSYQAIARDASGLGISNQNIGLRISILEGSTTGLSVYTETHLIKTDVNGVLNLAIGTGTATNGTFSTINWGAGTYFVQIEMDITGGTTYVLMGTSQLLSVPYALYAGNVNMTKNNTPMEVYISDEGSMHALPKIAVEKPYSPTPSVTDIDGNTYGTVKIGTQVWMTENLRTKKLNDGTPIPNVTNGTDWINLTSPAYANCNNTLNADTINAFGRMYNFYAVNTNKLCPTGWHVPSNAEVQTLLTYLGPLTGFRVRAKEYWTDNRNAINDSKLSAYPAGERIQQYSPGEFVGIGTNAAWWSSTASSGTHAFILMINDNTVSAGYAASLIERQSFTGESVRCVKN